MDSPQTDLQQNRSPNTYKLYKFINKNWNYYYILKKEREMQSKGIRTLEIIIEKA